MSLSNHERLIAIALAWTREPAKRIGEVLGRDPRGIAKALKQEGFVLRETPDSTATPTEPSATPAQPAGAPRRAHARV